MGSRGLFLGGLGVGVGCWGRHFGGPRLECCYDGWEAWGDRVRSIILAERYMVDMLEVQEGRNSFDKKIQCSVRRHVFTQFIYLCNSQCRGSRYFFLGVTTVNECGSVCCVLCVVCCVLKFLHGRTFS